MKFKIIILISILFGMPLTMGGQSDALNRKLKGIDNLDDIMEVVDQHYAEIRAGTRIQTDEIKYKHWARWAYYMSARTAPGGKLVDIQKNIREALLTRQSGNRSSNGNWSFVGPQSISGDDGSAIGIGRVDRIAFHPTDPNILYIATPNGGLWKTTNGGTTWAPLTDNIPSLAVSGIVISHANPNVIYIITGNGDNSWTGGFLSGAGYFEPSAGVFVSYDAGINWLSLAPLPISGSYAGYQLVQDPGNAAILMAATDIGIFRTTNAGGSWDTVLLGRTFEIKYRPGDPDYVYATQSGKIFRSVTAGAIWTEITNFDVPMLSGRVALAVSNSQPDQVYLLSGWSSTTNVFGGLYLSINAGASFTRQSYTPNVIRGLCDGNGGVGTQSAYDLALGASHVSSNEIIAGGIWAWRSSDTGVNWSNVSAGACGSYTSATGYVHADVHDIEYHPLTGDVYLCSDGGLHKSVNHGQDWINVSDGIAATQIYHMAGSSININRMMIGTQDNGVKRRHTNTDVWDHVAGGDGFDIVYNNNSSLTGYFSTNNRTFRFTNNGIGLNDVTPDSATKFFPRVEVHNTMAGFVLAGYDSLWRSTDYGANWWNRNISGNWDIERCPNDDAQFYAAGGTSAFATAGKIWRSVNDGVTWQLISSNPGAPVIDLRITDIDVRPNISNHVFFTFGGFGDGKKVYQSYNAGESWTNISGSLPNVPVNAIQVDQSGNIYIGTDIGVFYRGFEMSDWVPFWHKLPIIPISDLELYEDDNTIRASTFGRGVWESDTYTTCPEQWIIFSNIQGNRYYETSNWITCNATIYGGQNTDVVFKAGDHIILSQGFQVGAGNRFKAYTAPCGIADIEEE